MDNVKRVYDIVREEIVCEIRIRRIFYKKKKNLKIFKEEEEIDIVKYNREVDKDKKGKCFC